MATVGLKNLYYAPLTADTAASLTYGAMKKIAGAIQVDINPSITFNTLYGDDAPFATDSSMTEISVTIETADLPLEDQAALLGHTVDSTTKELVAKASDVAPYVGLAFESNKHNGKVRYVKLLKGKFSPTQETIQTKGESVQYTTPKLEGRFVARENDGEWKRIVDSDNTESAALIAAWYTNMEPAASTAVAGSNTYTVTTNFVSTDTVTFNGVTLTAGTDFNVGEDSSASASNLATAMASKSGINSTYTVTAEGAVITVTETVAGGGNTPGSMTVTGTGVITAGTATPSQAGS